MAYRTKTHLRVVTMREQISKREFNAMRESLSAHQQFIGNFQLQLMADDDGVAARVFMDKVCQLDDVRENKIEGHQRYDRLLIDMLSVEYV